MVCPFVLGANASRFVWLINLAGLLDYMVDFGKKEVTVRGTVLHTKKKSKKRKKHKEDDNNGAVDSSWENRSSSSSSSSSLASNQSSRTLSWFLGCYGS